MNAPDFDDGLIVPEVRNWSEEKYNYIKYYSRMFAKGMKYKWDCRVYIDIFAGAGCAKIEGMTRVVPASPFLALEVPDPFDVYIYAESDQERINALRSRVERYHPDKDVRFVPGDCNDVVEAIVAQMPMPSSKNRVLSFCLVDPFKMTDFRFATLKCLSKYYVDFLVLIPSFMDINRNRKWYTDDQCKYLDMYLGNSDWRERWKYQEKTSDSFGFFIAQEFGNSMKGLGYLFETSEDMILFRSSENRKLYHLAFFSRDPRGLDFWRKARKHAPAQRDLFR